MANAGPSTSKTITVPYSGEIKKGLLIIINREEYFGTCLITYVKDSTFHTLNSKNVSSGRDLGINNITYSNGIFTLEFDTYIGDNCKVAFLQLNLD